MATKTDEYAGVCSKPEQNTPMAHALYCTGSHWFGGERIRSHEDLETLRLYGVPTTFVPPECLRRFPTV